MRCGKSRVCRSRTARHASCYLHSPKLVANTEVMVMALPKTQISLVAIAALFLAVGCAPTPEKVGDECAPDGDPCPTPSVCKSKGEIFTCQVPEIPAGGACDPAGPDYCAGDLICGAKPDGTGTCGIAAGGACEPANSQCAGGLSCAEMQAGGNACYPPVLLKGMVFDSESNAAVADAQVMALDDQATAKTDIALTDAMGNYTLEIPVARQADGVPIVSESFTLRASASGYQTFPGGLRTALPISSSEAKSEMVGYVIDTALTKIALISLPMEQKGLPSITGKVLADEQSGGVLVVADDAAGKGMAAIADKSGAYTIFNVPDGMYTVKGYAAGLQLTPASANMAGMPLTGVDLALSTNALGTINGSLNIVNPGDGMNTSVVLVVASTFSETFVRGEVPRGLRTPLSGPPDVSGAFTIKDVPEGEYYVLAAFENDFLVRDPDPNISGTQLVKQIVPSPGSDINLPTSFKITGALPVVGPGVDAPEAVTTAPTLSWGDDSSEDFYTVVVYNAYGELVWCRSDQMMGCGPNIPSVNGSSNVSVPYEGPLETGMYYQFRASSWRSVGGKLGPISTTEDLRGVFYVDVAK